MHITRTNDPFFGNSVCHLLPLVIACCCFSLGFGISPLASTSLTLQGSQQSEAEPVSLKVVGISVVDFFRTMSELSGLNFLIDPDVSGSLTLNVEQVSWDQLMETVLESQGLIKTIRGNLVRISTQGSLRQEQQARRQLRQTRQEAAETITMIRRLSYASGSEIVPILQQHLSSRGTINVDERTNTLVITDIPSVIERVMGLTEREQNQTSGPR